MKLINQGAEARIYATNFLGKETIIKERFSKKYRHPILDQKLTQSRVSQESKNIVKCQELGLPVPTVYHVDLKEAKIYMEHVHGITVKEFLYKNECDSTESLELAKIIGFTLAKLHNATLIHGDLTTSNFLLRDGKYDQLVIIDLGLSCKSNNIEDKAVDLYVLERALLSTHPNSEKFNETMLNTYEQSVSNSKNIMTRLEKVRQRGRKRDMIG
eukprot:gene2071-1943_t